jgi:murein L,D-transpeptidase YcbB/YkuD
MSASLLLGCALSAAAAEMVMDNPLAGPALADETMLVQGVYAQAEAPLLWTARGQPTAQGHALLRLIADAADFGLRPEDYGAARLATATAQLKPDSSATDLTLYDRLLTRAAVRLVSHLHYGRVAPSSAGFELPAPRTDLDVAAAVAAMASAADVAAAVAAIEPHFFHYHLLEQALLRYRSLLSDPTLTALPRPAVRNLRAGDAYAGAPQLRHLLLAEGDLPPVPDLAGAPPNTLDAPLVAALRRYQERHGLTADGSLGADTYQSLTTPIAARVRQIELTLERWRWLPAFGSPPIIVNIPEFQLFAFATTEDRVASILQMPVIVGEAYPNKQTPIFVGDLRYLVMRPYWDVPRSIVLREMLPKIRASETYLRKNHLEIVAGDGDSGAVLEPTPENLEALGAGRARLRQQPGEDNALGLIKFIFPNVHDVFLHSTPARALFGAASRAFSHGCIRVSDPVALAEFVLRSTDGGRWSAAQIDTALHQGPDNQRVALAEPIKVMILYGTALATEAGPVDFFPDIYCHDRRLERLLGLAAVSQPTSMR